jgi:hypothetical protein
MVSTNMVSGLPRNSRNVLHSAVSFIVLIGGLPDSPIIVRAIAFLHISSSPSSP